jgi:hypothetical protein
MPEPEHSLDLALRLAALGWHVFPLSPRDKRPLANCPTCKPRQGITPHPIEHCPCLPTGGWCHGVRAATTDPQRITAWWTAQPLAAVGIAAGPSRLVLVDIDAHGAVLPESLATGLLPGIDLTAERINPDEWSQPGQYRDGRDALRLLALLRGGTHPWPAGPQHRPVTADTPSGGRHLWYRAPPGPLHQAIGKLAWQVDIKAGWSYGLAPGTTTANGTYQHCDGDPANPGTPPGWLAREIRRVAGPPPPRPETALAMAGGAARHPPVGRPSAYLQAVLTNGTGQLAGLMDGRQRALSALAYKVGGLLAASGLTEAYVLDQLVTAAAKSGLPYPLAERLARRSLANGQSRPLTPRPHTS